MDKEENRKMNKLRHAGHMAFDALWMRDVPQGHWRSRTECYQWLAIVLEIKKKECHFRCMSDTQILAAIEMVATRTCPQCFRRFGKQMKRDDHVDQKHENWSGSSVG